MVGDAELRAIELEAYGDWREVSREANLGASSRLAAAIHAAPLPPVHGNAGRKWVDARRKPMQREEWRARRAEYLRRKA